MPVYHAISALLSTAQAELGRHRNEPNVVINHHSRPVNHFVIHTSRPKNNLKSRILAINQSRDDFLKYTPSPAPPRSPSAPPRYQPRRHLRRGQRCCRRGRPPLSPWTPSSSPPPPPAKAKAALLLPLLQQQQGTVPWRCCCASGWRPGPGSSRAAPAGSRSTAPSADPVDELVC